MGRVLSLCAPLASCLVRKWVRGFERSAALCLRHQWAVQFLAQLYFKCQLARRCTLRRAESGVLGGV